MTDMAALERDYMEKVPEVLSWTVAEVGDHGPVTMSLRLPEVTITDAAGRFIVVTPKQAETIASRLTDIYCRVLDVSE